MELIVIRETQDKSQHPRTFVVAADTFETLRLVDTYDQNGQSISHHDASSYIELLRDLPELSAAMLAEEIEIPAKAGE